MTTAQKIMKKKLAIKEEMDRQLTRKQSDFLWCLLHNKSTKKLQIKMEKVASPFWRLLYPFIKESCNFMEANIPCR